MLIYTVIWLIKYYPKKVKFFSDDLESHASNILKMMMLILVVMLISELFIIIIELFGLVEIPDLLSELIFFPSGVVLFSDLYILFVDLIRCKFNLWNFKPTNITIIFIFYGFPNMPAV